jgi:hypothetical protein
MKYLLIFTILIVAFSCSPSRHVVPLGRKERAVSASIGGPVINNSSLSVPVPLPMASVSYAYGITKKTTRIAAVHITPMIFGTYHLEAGFLREFYYNKKRKIGFTSNLMGNLIFDHNEWNVKFYPQVDVNLYWHFLGDAHYFCDCPKDRGLNQFIYLGATNWFELDRKDEYGISEGQRFLLNPHFGYNFGSKKMKFNLEVKYYLPYVKTASTGVDYFNPINDYGAFGGTFGIYWLF